MAVDTNPTPPVVAARQPVGWVVPIMLFAIAFLLYGSIGRWHHVDRHYFVPLAQALLLGKIDVGTQPGFLNELVPVGTAHYVVYPPLPALFVLPWVVVQGGSTNQLWACLMLGALNVSLVYVLARRVGEVASRAVLWAIVFGFGTVTWFAAQNGNSWLIAQVGALTFLLAALCEVFGRGRAWLMGVFLGLSMLCRLDELFAFPFFVAAILHASRRGSEGEDRWAIGTPWPTSLPAVAASFDWPAVVRRLVGFGLGLGAFVGVYLAYNYARFGSPLQTGYSLIPGILNEPWYRDGFFNLKAIPRNFYNMILKAPNFVDEAPFIKPNRIGGFSMLLTTPFFLWAVKSRGWGWFPLGAWLAIVGVLAPIYLHGDTGGAEFGYRYAMDVYPFLLLLAVKGAGPRMSFEQKLALGLGFLVNAWGIWAQMTDNWS